MSDKKLAPLEVVERYHEKYLEYETAFNKNPFTEKQRQEEVIKIAKSDMDLESEEFLNKMAELMIDKNYKIADVNNSAAKFVMAVDFYLLTQEEDLPEEVLNNYNSLPIKDSIKTYFSIENGEFVRNEDVILDDETKNYFKALIKQIRDQV